MTGPSAYKVSVKNARKKVSTGKRGGDVLAQVMLINARASNKVHPEGPCETLILNANHSSKEPGALHRSGTAASERTVGETDDRSAEAGSSIEMDAIAAQIEREHSNRLIPDKTEMANRHEGSALFQLGSSDLSSHRDDLNSASAGTDVPSSSQRTCHTGLAASNGRSFDVKEVDAPVPVETLWDKCGEAVSESQGRASAGRRDDGVEEGQRWLQDDTRRWIRAENLIKKIKRKKAKLKLKGTELGEESA